MTAADAGSFPLRYRSDPFLNQRVICRLANSKGNFHRADGLRTALLKKKPGFGNPSQLLEL